MINLEDKRKKGSNVQTRICSKCYIEKPLTLEFYAIADKNNGRMHRECRICKKNYLKQYQINKRLSRDPEADRVKELYTMKEPNKEEQKERLEVAYAYIYRNAFGKSITRKQLNKIKDIKK